jgi:hypothetical protein
MPTSMPTYVFLFPLAQSHLGKGIVEPDLRWPMISNYELSLSEADLKGED